jgi:hypothetical protein
MADWTSPLKKPKAKTAEKTEAEILKPFKKLKPKVSTGATRAILDTHDDVGTEVGRWTERWIEQLVRERCLPPQLISSDFLSLLGKFLVPEDALTILTRIRTDYRREFPLSKSNAPVADFDLTDLVRIIESDAVAKEWIEEQRKVAL